MPSQRQLAAIMFTDIVGYTALMGSDEENALAMLRMNRAIHKAAIDKYDGKWLKEIGDAVLAQFSSAVHAVQCALEIQKNAQNLGAKIRIGIHLGDVTFENNDVFGDGVNIASRIQSIADPGGIYVTESIYNAIRSQAEIQSRFLGAVPLKNVDYRVGTYSIVAEFLPLPDPAKVNALLDVSDKRQSRSIIFGLATIILVTIAIVWWISAHKEVSIRSLVVLPVENRTGNPDVDFYTDGIHDDIVNEIGKISALRIPSTRTALKYRESRLSIPEIARELGVEGVVEASLFHIGDSVRIRINLIAAVPEERRIWSKEFIRDMPHILSLYGDVANSIARELKIQLTADQVFRFASNKEVIPQAYEAYIKGMSYWHKLTKNDLDQALRYFELAVEIDPGYAPAYAGVAMVWGGRMQQGILPAKEVASTLDSIMSKALELDSTLIEVHYMVALMYTWWNWDWQRADKAFKKAIALNPNHAGVRAYYSHYLNIIGKPNEAMSQIEKALKLDPFNPLFQALYGMDLNYARKFDDVIALLNKTQADSPNDPVALSALRAAYHNKKEFNMAYKTFVRSYEAKHDQEGVSALEAGYAAGGYTHSLISLAELLKKRSAEHYVTPFQIATLYTRAGKKEEAVQYLSLAYDDHDPNMPYINIDPIFDDLRTNPGFQELITKMNFPPNP